MSTYWRDHLMDQLDFYWEFSLYPRLEALTDEEYFWEPVESCWSIRPKNGSYAIDWEHPEPSPPPVTTIAWRMAHISVGVFGIRASRHFGDGSLTVERATWPGSAESGVKMLEESRTLWRDGVMRLDDEALTTPVGDKEPGFEEHSIAALILHLNRETMHHGAEIALLRDLYRAKFGM